MKPAQFWTDFELDVLEKHYRKFGAQFCDELIFAHHGWRRGRRNVMQKANKIGIHYEGEKRSIFKKGNVSHNKGQPMPEHVREKVSKTWFEAGHIPHNARSQGDDVSLRMNKGYPMVYLRVSLGKWVQMSRHVYESYYGPLPKGHVVCFIDGDSTNCNIENLYSASRGELARRNHNRDKIKRDAAELTDAYVVSYFKRYEHVEVDIKEAIETGLIEVMRSKIRLKRSLSNNNSNGNQIQKRTYRKTKSDNRKKV